MNTHFEDLAIARRSIRRYTSEPISPDEVKSLLECALLSPTSKNCRAWHFVVVEDREMLARLGECTPHARPIANAPLAIVVGCDSTVSDVWTENCSIAASYIQLQASALGLGSCWIQVRNRIDAGGTFSEDVIREALNIPEEIGIDCVISIGHPDEQRKPLDTEKLLWEKVHIDKW